jgi:GT2 family glycosyltransferase
MNEGPLVSVITIAYNRPGGLPEFLDSVFQSSYRPLEVLVVNNSEERYRDGYEMVLARYPGVVHLWSGKNLLISGALNWGIRVARGELLLCCGDDNVFDREMAGRLVEFMLVAKDVAVAGPVVLYASGDGILTAGHSVSLTSGLPANTRTGITGNIEVEIVDNVFMIRAAVLKEIGGFDERNFPFYLESADLCMRARNRGYRCVTVSQARAWHKYAPLAAGVIPNPDRYGSNAITYYYLFKTKIRYIRKYSAMWQKGIFFGVFLPLLLLWHAGIILFRSRQNPWGKLAAVLKGTWDGIHGRP